MSRRISKSDALYFLFLTWETCPLEMSYTRPPWKTCENFSAVSLKHTALISPPSESSRSTLRTLPSPLALCQVRIAGWLVTRTLIVQRFMYGFREEIGVILGGASFRATAPRLEYCGGMFCWLGLLP